MKINAAQSELPRLDAATAVGGGVAALLLLIAAVHSAVTIPKSLWNELYIALENGEPVVRVNYLYFGGIGMVIVGITLPLFAGLVLLARPLRLKPSRFQACAQGLLRVLVLGGILFLPVPMVVGPVVSEYVEAQGYKPCGALFEFGFMRYIRGFVSDPQLCVPPWRLEEALERFEQK